MNKIITVILFLALITSCENDINNEGVSRELATHRKSYIKNVEYDLSFILDSLNEKTIEAKATVSFFVEKAREVVLDFKHYDNIISDVVVNDSTRNFSIINEHIVIPKRLVKDGINKIKFKYKTCGLALNNREELSYVTCIPDNASTLFPCFDQPDIKALFRLQLTTPKEWKAISNCKISKIDSTSNPTKTIYNFAQTKLISTHLFTFLTGKFSEEKFIQKGDTIRIYHREINSTRISQIGDIAKKAFFAIEWMEKYTGIPYPFPKLDLIIIPSFKYETLGFVGVSMFEANKIFLPYNDTISDKINQISLIGREISCAWIGGLVTMDWFNGIWVKDMFASFFEMQIIKDYYPDLDADHILINMFINSYEEDRSNNSVAIHQAIDNANETKISYSNIRKDKAVICLLKLYKGLGSKPFQDAVSQYIKKYAYSNASWHDFLDILNQHTDYDITLWSKIWLETTGMPIIESGVENDSLYTVQTDPLNRGTKWMGFISFLAVGDDFRIPVEVNLTTRTNSIRLPKGTNFVIPNHDLRAYGFFVLDSKTIQNTIENLHTFKDPLTKASILINLHENMLNNNISPKVYSRALMNYISKEKNNTLFDMALANLCKCRTQYIYTDSFTNEIEEFLWRIIDYDTTLHRKNKAINEMIVIASSRASKIRLLGMYMDTDNILMKDLNTRLKLSYTVALEFPDISKNIVSKQIKEIENPDILAEYLYVSKGTSPDITVRDSIFHSLLKKGNRTIEQWTIQAMGLLNHPSRQSDALKYIKPALEILPELNKTNGLLFSKIWINSLLWGHNSHEAYAILDKFIKDNKKVLHPSLLRKLKQKAYVLNPNKTTIINNI